MIALIIILLVVIAISVVSKETGKGCLIALAILFIGCPIAYFFLALIYNAATGQ